ncbi:AbrB/MazE/SpoVT family DNA-binding domain-containing protein [Candidatus Nitrospira salsa]
MKTTIDLSGRLVIPKEIRRVAGLEPGIPLEVRWREGVVEIEPSPIPVKLTKRGRLLVAVPEKPITSLTHETVKQTRQQVRHGRSSTS